MSNVDCENTGPTNQGQRQRPASKSWRAAAGSQHTEGEHPFLKAQLSQRTGGGMTLASWVVGHIFLIFPTFHTCFVSTL